MTISYGPRLITAHLHKVPCSKGHVINTNVVLVTFFQQNWLLLIMLIASIIPIFPPQWFNYTTRYYIGDLYQPGAYQRRQKVSFLHALVKLAIQPISALIFDLMAPLQVLMKYKEVIIIMIFLVVGFDVFYRKQISREAITLVSIGILALYFEQLIEKGKKIDGFFHLISWEAKDNPFSLPVQNVPPVNIPPTTAIEIDRGIGFRSYVRELLPKLLGHRLFSKLQQLVSR